MSGRGRLFTFYTIKNEPKQKLGRRMEWIEKADRPAAAVEEGDQRQEEGHVLNALGLDHCALQNR